MRRLIILGIILVFFMGKETVWSKCYRISGEIISSTELNQEVTILAVRIPPTQDQMFYTTKICGTGEYQFDSLPDGIYLVSAFVDLNGSEGPNPGELVGIYPQLVILANGNTAEHVDIHLMTLPASTGSISGKVLFNGEIAGPVKIISLGLSMTPFNYTMVNLNQSNEFKIDKLGTGKYILFGFMDLNRDGFPGLGEPLGSVTKFINVTQNLDTPNIDLTLTAFGNYSGAISGNVHYSGSMYGHIMVSAVGLSRTPLVSALMNPFDSNYVVNDLAAGQYGVVAFMDLNGDLQPNLNEPMCYYDKGTVTVNNGETVASVDLVLKDPVSGKGVVSGQVNYYEGGLRKALCEKIYVVAIGISETPLASMALTGVGGYELTGLKTGLYLIAAYADLNDNGTFDTNEPVGFYKDSPVFVFEGFPSMNIDILLQNLAEAEGSLTGTISYSGTQTGPVQILGFGCSKTPFFVQSLNTPGNYQIDNLGMGLYLILAFIDSNENGFYEPGEPFGFYPNLRTVVGFQATENVNFELIDKGTGGISGKVYYSGSESGIIRVGAFGLSNTPFAIVSLSGAGDFLIPDLTNGLMLVWAYLDVNEDGFPGPGEPFALYPELVTVSDGVITKDISLVLSPFSITDIPKPESGKPVASYRLEQNYPNPFNAETSIRYQLAQTSDVEFIIFNTLGEEIQKAVLGTKSAGEQTFHWNGKDRLGNAVPSGVYYYRIEAGDFQAMKKLLLLK